MLHTHYISHCTENDLDELKLALLFFDRIDVVENVLVEVEPEASQDRPMRPGDIGTITRVYPLVTDAYKQAVATLVREGWLTIGADRKKVTDPLWNQLNAAARQLLVRDPGLLLEESEVQTGAQGQKISARIKFPLEVKRIHQAFIGPLEVGSRIDTAFIFEYYAQLLSSLLFHTAQGGPCLTGSEALHHFLAQAYRDPALRQLQQELPVNQVRPSLASAAIRLAVPDISAFPLEEVLQIREKAKNELTAFRNELATFQFNLLENYSWAEIDLRSKDLIQHKLNPGLKALKDKITHLDLAVPKKILDEFKDPKSYTPLLGSVLGQIPSTLAVLLSLGLISLSTAYDYLLSRKEIHNNGLYYLIQLDRKFGQKRTVRN